MHGVLGRAGKGLKPFIIQGYFDCFNKVLIEIHFVFLDSIVAYLVCFNSYLSNCNGKGNRVNKLDSLVLYMFNVAGSLVSVGVIE